MPSDRLRMDALRSRDMLQKVSAFLEVDVLEWHLISVPPHLLYEQYDGVRGLICGHEQA